MQFQKLNTEQMNAKQHKVAREICTKLASGISGPYVSLFYSPDTAALVQRLDEYLRYGLRMPERLRILAVLVAAGQFSGEDILSFLQIEAPADCGLSADVVNAIKNHDQPTDLKEDEALVYEFVSELANSGRVNDLLFERARAMFDREVCLELVKVSGFAIFIRNTMNATGQFFQRG